MFKKISSWSDGNSSFLRAARAGNLEKVLEYLKGSIDINTSNANGLNALHLASKEGHVNVVTELLDRGANVDAATKKGNTALHIASLAGQEEIVKILVQRGAKVNAQATTGGFTPLYMAAQENHTSVVKYLLNNGASQTLSTDDGFTPLAVALQQGHDKVVAVLLENDTRGKVKLPALHIAAKKDDVKAATLLLQNEHSVDGQSKSGFTPLHIASHYGNINVGTLLIDKGANVNFKARNQITPLHVASKWGKTNMVTLLLDNGTNIDACTRDGLTALHCAARSGHDQVVDLLLEKGAPVDSKTKNKLSPLHMAAQGDHTDCARLLLIHKAPMDDVTVDYLTPLHVAAHCGNVKTAKLLLDRKCEVNARALNGFTPLHIACKKNRIKVVELLLKYGASIEATTETGLTPLHVAAFMGHMNIVIYLIQHGANPDTPNMRGETALHHAARANQTDIMRILLRNGATVDAKAREQQTPLHIAARLGNVDNVLLLLQHGANPDATTKDLYTPLHIAAKEGHEEVVSVLLDHGASQTLTTKKGFTPLHIAAKYGNMQTTSLLLQKGADPNVQGKNGLTPLHVATHYNHSNVALLLLENGASPHSVAKNGYTPLHIAAKKNEMDIATTLLEYGAKTNADSKNGYTPLHLASQEGHTDMVSLLCEHGADVNCKAKNHLTPMHLAAQEDKVPVAEVLVKYGSEIDPQTKAGYTPLHTACHFGQINMIRFLLEHEADVTKTTKLGYTPLHQAAQQGHVLVINLLLKYKASPNAVTNNGQTPLSIAQRLGYISVVEILKNITEVQPQQTEDKKYEVQVPEGMHETMMTDSEDEGDDLEMPLTPKFGVPMSDQHVYLPYHEGQYKLDPSEDTLIGSAGDTSFQYMTTDDMKMLHDDSISPMKEVPLQAAYAPSLHTAMPNKAMEESKTSMYGSYSGVSFASSFDPDNVAVDRHPVYSGFLVSFMVDARGGAMRGCRHSGVRIIIPPGKACMPTRVTCKLVKKEKLMYPPPLMEGEALASRILEMGPVGARFLGPVIIEVPHFASLRGKEREIVILRSEDGETWKEHPMEATEDSIQEALGGSFEGEDLESAEELYHKRITRVLTTDFPNYFAIVTRIRQENSNIGPEGGMISSTVVPQVQAVFPEGSLTKKIKVGLQAQEVPSEVVTKMLGNRVAVSPIVTIEPRRRKFHKPITLTIPVPKAAQKGMLNQYGGDAPTLRLLCSITGGTSPAQWEDVTGTSPLTFVNDCVSFTTTVSARFWLMDCQNIKEASKMATDLYREAIAVPFMSKFVVFSKRHDQLESRLRVFCMTDDKMDKTLESQEHFDEVARSRDVEVLEGKAQYIEMGGNIVPVTKSGDQLYINFHAFRENRLPFTVRVRDNNADPVGRIAFMREPKSARGEAQQQPICNLNITLPDTIQGEPHSEMTSEELKRKYELMKSGIPQDDQISKAELRLTDIADALQGDWVLLAEQLEFSDEEIARIKDDYTYDGEQGLVMLHMWVQQNHDSATGNELERGLHKIGREDVVQRCMCNVTEVTDDIEKAVAKVHLDSAGGFDDLKDDIGPSAEPSRDPSRDASRDSSVHRGLSVDVNYDEQDIIKESESAAEESGSETGSVVDREREKTPVVEDEKLKEVSPPPRPATIVPPENSDPDHIVPEVNERYGVVKTPSQEEAKVVSEQKREAYLVLAGQLDELIDTSQQPAFEETHSEELESPIREEPVEAKQKEDEHPSAVEDLIQAMESKDVHGMDDRMSVSSDEQILVKDDKPQPKDDFEDVTDKQTKTPPPSPSEQLSRDEGQDITETELASHLADTDTFIQQTTTTTLESTPQVEEPGISRKEDLTDSEMQFEIIQKDEVMFEEKDEVMFEETPQAVPEPIEPQSEQEYEEAVLESEPIVHSKIDEDVLKDQLEEAMGDIVDSGDFDLRDAPVEPGSFVGVEDKKPQVDITGDIETNKDIEEYVETAEDGTTIKKTVTTVSHFRMSRRKETVQGVENLINTRVEVGKEVEEEIYELAPGVFDPFGDNVQNETSSEEFEENNDDGTWLKRTVVIVRSKPIHVTEPPRENLFHLASQPGDQLEKKYEPESVQMNTQDIDYPVGDTKQDEKQLKDALHEAMTDKDEPEEFLETKDEPKDQETMDGFSRTDTDPTDETYKDAVQTRSPEPSTEELYEEAPEELERSFEEIKGDFGTRKEEDESEEVKDDGTIVRTKITSIKHYQNIVKKEINKGVESTESIERPLGTEILEEIEEIGPGVTDVTQGVETKTSTQEHQESFEDGTWLKRKITTVTYTALQQPQLVLDSVDFEKEKGESPKDQAAISEKELIVVEPQVTEVEGEVQSKTEEDESVETKTDGTRIKKKVIIIKHYRTVTRKIVIEEIESIENVEIPVGTEVLEHIEEFGVGVEDPSTPGVETRTAVQEHEESFEDGTWLKKTVTTVSYTLLDESVPIDVTYASENDKMEHPTEEKILKMKEEQAKDVSKGSEPIIETIQGKFDQRTEEDLSEEIKEDGIKVRRHILIISHYQNMTRKEVIEDTENVETYEKPIGTEIIEDIQEYHPSVDISSENAIKTANTKEEEETFEDGTWLKKRITVTKIEMSEPSESVEQDISDEKGIAEETQSEVEPILEEIAGDIEIKSEEYNTEETADDGTLIKKHTKTTTYFQNVTQKQLRGDIETVDSFEKLLGVEVVEHIEELSTGVLDLSSPGVQTKSSVEETEQIVEDGTWVKRKVVRVVAELVKESMPSDDIIFEKEDELRHLESDPDNRVFETVPQVDIPEKRQVDKPFGEVDKEKQIFIQADELIEEKQVDESVRGLREEKQVDESSKDHIEDEQGDEPTGDQIEEEQVDQPADDLIEDKLQDKPLLIEEKWVGKVELEPSQEKQIKEPKREFIEEKVLDKPIIELCEGEYGIRTEESKSEETREDGTVISKIIVITHHFQNMTRKEVIGDTETIENIEKPIGREIIENIHEMHPGVKDISAQEVETKTSVQEKEELLGDGTWLKSIVNLVTATLIEKAKDEPIIMDVPGDMKTKTDVQEFEETREDGTRVRKTITIVKHIQNVMKKEVIGEMESTEMFEKHIGTEVIEDITELSEGVQDIDEYGVETKTSVQETEESLEDETWLRKKVTTVNAILISAKKLVLEGEEELNYDSFEPEETESAIPIVKLPQEEIPGEIASVLKPVVKEIFGDITTKIEQHESQELQDNGFTVKKNVKTIKHFQNIQMREVINETEKIDNIEKHIGTEVLEEINKISPEVQDVNDPGVETKTSIEEQEEVQDDGTWIKKKVITMTSILANELGGEIKEDIYFSEKPVHDMYIEETPSGLVNKTSDNHELYIEESVQATKEDDNEITQVYELEEYVPPEQAEDSSKIIEQSENILGEQFREEKPCDIEPEYKSDKIHKSVPEEDISLKVNEMNIVKLEEPALSMSTEEKVMEHTKTDYYIEPVVEEIPGKIVTKTEEQEIEETEEPLIEEIHGDLGTETEEHELEEIKDDGTIVKKRITTIRHYQNVLRKEIIGKSESIENIQKHIGTEIIEDIQNLLPGVQSVDDPGTETETSVQEDEETQPDGSWLKKKIIAVTTTLLEQRQPPENVFTKSDEISKLQIEEEQLQIQLPHVELKPEEKQKTEIIDGEGEIGIKTEEHELQEIREDGYTIKKKITVMSHYQNITRKTMTGASESVENIEKPIGKEIVEEIKQLAPGIDDLGVSGTGTKTSVQQQEEILEDGTWIKRHVTTVEYFDEQQLPLENTTTQEISHEKEQVESPQQELTPIDTENILLLKHGETPLVEEYDMKHGEKAPEETKEQIERLPSEITAEVVEIGTPVTQQNDSIINKEVIEIEGTIGAKTDVEQSEYTRDDGYLIKSKISTITHIQNMTQQKDEINIASYEKLIGTEIIKETEEIAPGINESQVSCIDSKVSESVEEQSFQDGTWVKTKTIIKITSFKEDISKEMEMAMEDEQYKMPSSSKNQPDVCDEETKGDFGTSTEETEFEETKEDGTVIKTRIITVRHFQDIIRKSVINEKESVQHFKQPVGTEIFEEITELGTGVNSTDMPGTSKKTSVQEQQESFEDGTWLKKTVTTVTLILDTIQGTTTESQVAVEAHDLESTYTSEKPITTEQDTMAEPVKDIELLIVEQGISEKPPVTDTTEQVPISEVIEDISKGDVKDEVTTEEKIQSKEIDESAIISDKPVEEVLATELESALEPVSEISTEQDTFVTDKPKEMSEIDKILETEGEVISNTEKKESEITQDDGTVIRKKVTVTSFCRDVFRKTQDGEISESLKPVGKEISEEIFEISPGVEELSGPGVEVKSVTQEHEETLENGTWLKKKIITNKYKLIDKGVVDQLQQYPDTDTLYLDTSEVKNEGEQALQLEEIKGEIECKSETEETEEKLEDGTIVKRQITVITHYRNIITKETINGATTEFNIEKPLGKEVIENIEEYEPGIIHFDEENLERKMNQTEQEETLEDGTWLKKKTSIAKIGKFDKPIESVGEVAYDHSVLIEKTATDVIESYPVTTEKVEIPVSKDEYIEIEVGTQDMVSAEKTKADQVDFPEDLAEVQFKAVPQLGEIIQSKECETRVEEDESEEFRDDGTHVKRKIEVIKHSRVAQYRKLTNHSEYIEDIEEPIGTEIIQTITEFGPGVHNLKPDQTVESNTSVDDSENILEDGTWMKQRTTTTVVKIKEESTDLELSTGMLETVSTTKDVDRSPDDDESGSLGDEAEASEVSPSDDIPPVPVDEQVPVDVQTVITEESLESEQSYEIEKEDDDQLDWDIGPGEYGSDENAVNVYMDRLDGEPETDVQEFEETLPDGTVVKRRVVRTKQSQTIVKRVVTESTEDDITPTDSEVFDITHKGEPETDVEEYEETLPDGTVVKRKVIKTKQVVVREVITEGQNDIPIDDAPSELSEKKPILSSTEPCYTAETIKGEIETNTETKEYQETKDDGTIVKHVVITTTHNQPITERTVVDGVGQIETYRKLIGTDIEDDILEYGPGIDSPDAGNLEKHTDVQISKETLDNGSWVQKKITTTQLVPIKVVDAPSDQVFPAEILPAQTKAEPLFSGQISANLEKAQEMKPREVTEGNVTVKTEVDEKEEVKKDGTLVKTKTATTSHFVLVTVTDYPEGKPVESISEKPIGKELVLEVTELGPGIEHADMPNTERDTSVQQYEEMLEDGTWVKTTIRKLTVTGKTLKVPIVVEGDIQTTINVEEKEETKEDGTLIKRKITTERHFRMVTITEVIEGTEQSKEIEKTVGTEVDENILELSAGIDSPEADNVEKQTSVQEHEENLEDGTWLKKKVTTTTINPKKSVIAPCDQLIQSMPSLVSEDLVQQDQAYTDLQKSPIIKPKEIVESDVQTKTNIEEKEEVKDDGTVVKIKTITTQYILPVTVIELIEGNEVQSYSEKPLGKDVQVDILELSPGIESPDTPNTEKKVAVEEKEETLEDGSWLKTKKTTVSVCEVKDVTPIKAEGDIETKTHIDESEEKREDGTLVRRKITIIRHFRTVTITEIVEGKEETKDSEKSVGTEINEDVWELAPGIDSPDTENVEKQTTVQNHQETLDDGTWLKKKLVTTVVTPVKSIQPPLDTQIKLDDIIKQDTREILQPEEVPINLQTSQELKPKEIVEGDIETKVSVIEKEETKEDGTLVQTKTVTTKHFVPLTTVEFIDDKEVRNETEKPIGTAIVQDILQLAPGVKSMHTSNTQKRTSVQEKEETIEDGTWIKYKVTTISVFPVLPDSSEVIEGDVVTSTDEDESEERMPDGTLVRRKIITVKHSRNIITTEVVDGIEHTKQSPKLVGTEVNEDVLELAPGVESPDASNIAKQVSVKQHEESLEDGTWLKKKTTTTSVKTVNISEPPTDEGYAIPEQISEELIQPDELAVGLQKSPEIKPKEVTEGDIQTKSDVKESEETREDGTLVKTKIITTTHFRPVSTVEVFEGMEKVTETEKHEGTDIDENITEYAPGTDKPDAVNIQKKTSVQEREETLSDGTWVKHRITTVSYATMFEETDIIGGEVQTRTDMKESEDTLKDGTVVKKKVQTTTHFTIIQKTEEVEGSQSLRETEHILGKEIQENVLQLAPGITSPNTENTRTQTSTQEQRQTLEDGTWVKKIVTTVCVTPVSQTDKPTVEVMEGDIETQTSVQETTETREDGTQVKRKVTTTQHYQVITTKDVVEGIEQIEDVQKSVGTEIMEDILELAPGTEGPFGENVETKTSTQQFEETLEDGSWVKKTVKTVSVVSMSVTEPSKSSTSDISEHSPEQALVNIQNFPESHPVEVEQNYLEGEVHKKSETEEFEEMREDGTIVKYRIYTIYHFQSSRKKSETDVKELVGKEITQDIQEIGPGITNTQGSNIQSKVSTKEEKEMLEDGTWLKQKVTVTKFHFLGEPIEEDIIMDEYIQKGRARVPRDTLDDHGRDVTPVPEDISRYEDRERTPVYEDAIDEDFVLVDKAAILQQYPEDDYAPLTLDDVDTSLEEFEPPEDLMSPVSEYEEIEELQPDGTVVKRKVLSQKIKKTVTRKIRRVGPDGEVIEDVVTEEIPESELLSESSRASSVRSSISDARELTSPIPMSPAEIGTPAELEGERSSVRVYTDTIEGEPEIETDVQEFEETLPDGTIVKRKVIKTKQKQTIVKRVVMEGPETDLPTTEEQAQAMLSTDGGFQPELRYTDHTEEEPQTATQVHEFEETLPDGTVVKKKVVTTTEEQMKTQRTVVEAGSPPPEVLEGETVCTVNGERLQDQHMTEDFIEADQRPHRTMKFAPAGRQSSEDEIIATQRASVEGAPAPHGMQEIDEQEVVATLKDEAEKRRSFHGEVTSESQEKIETSQIKMNEDGADFVEGTDDRMSSSSCSEVAQVEDVYRPEGDMQLITTDEGQLDVAQGGELQTAKLVMKKQIHKKTVIRDGKEETIVTEDTHVEQDNDGPDELKDSMQQIIDQFMEGSAQLGEGEGGGHETGV